MRHEDDLRPLDITQLVASSRADGLVREVEDPEDRRQ